MTTEARTAVIYARISEKDDTVDKVANQIESLRALAAREGYSVLEPVFTDDGVSAYRGKKKREGFLKLMARIKAGGVDYVLAIEPYRLTRGSAAEAEALNLLCAAAGTKLHTLNAGVQDPSTPMTRALMQIQDILGGVDVETRVHKQVLRNDAETNIGKPLWGRRPFGFAGVIELNHKGKETVRWIKHEPVEADAIRWAVDFFLKPEGTIYGVMLEWNARKLRTTAAGHKRRKDGSEFSGDWTYASVRAILQSPRIAGLVVRHGVVQDGVKAAWEPIVTRDAWQAVADKMDDPTRRSNTGRKPRSLGSGLVTCICGLPMRATSVGSTYKGVRHTSPGLRCDVGRMLARGRSGQGVQHVSVRDDVLNSLIIDAVASAFLVGPANMLSPDDGVDLRAIETELAQVRADRARLVSLVAKDLVSESDIDTHLRPLKIREAALVEQRAEAVSKSAHAAMAVDLRAAMFEGKRVNLDTAAKAKVALRERFESLPLAQQRELVRRLLEVTILSGQGVKADPGKRVVIRHKVVLALNDEEA